MFGARERARRAHNKAVVRDLRNRQIRRSYRRCSDIAGPLRTPQRQDEAVRFRRVAGAGRLTMLTLLVGVSAVAGLVFIGWLLQPEHVPGATGGGNGGALLIIARLGFCMVVGVELIRLVQGAGIWLLAMRAKDPVPMTPPAGLRVALLTTIVPAKEPIEMVEQTLAAMKQVRYDGHVDVWILDEGNDPAVKAMARRLGVHHFSRRGRPEYNEPAGPYRAKTKSGNHNAWRAEHERHYDVVAQMDPDHVPLPCFLERSLGYFRDADVGFVVAPQVYGNPRDSWVAAGASGQQYLFSGVVERGGNGLGAPLLIGTNHLYRPTTWAQIGGYQDSIIEDHLTSMHVQAAVNPATGNHWKGVYTPDVLAIGEGPTSWADYFNQQKRWSYGIWEILLDRRLHPPTRLRLRQRLLYGLVQFYYPSVAVAWVLGNLATAFYLTLGVTSIQLDGARWLALWGASMGSWLVLWQWLRRYNLAPHERRERAGPALLLTLFTGPIYVAAAASAVLRRPLAYAVTAKGQLRSAESLRTFRAHLGWATVAAGLLATSVVLSHGFPALRGWAALTLVAGIMPPVAAFASSRWAGQRVATEASAPETVVARATSEPARAAKRRSPAPVPAHDRGWAGRSGRAHVPSGRGLTPAEMTAHRSSGVAASPRLER